MLLGQLIAMAIVTLLCVAAGLIRRGKPKPVDYNIQPGESLIEWGMRQPEPPSWWPNGKCACGNCLRQARVIH